MLIRYYIFILVLSFKFSHAQLLVARDTITVIENNYVLKMPWANGINSSNVSNIDLNFDGKKDIVVYDHLNNFGVGRFRCFINNGNVNQTKYIAAPELSYYFPEAYHWAIFLDYNCDGLEDLFCYTSLGIMVYKNVSTPANILSFILVDSLIKSNYNSGGMPALYNIYASSQGIPAITDIDGDGDIDILTFSPLGSFIEFHKNLRKEKNYHCDSLIFELTDNCWGKVSESSCSTELNSNFCSPLKPYPINQLNIDNKIYHAGSCLTCIDSDGDGDKDLILGDIACDIVQYVHNTGTAGGALFTDTTKLYPNYPTKNNTTQIKLKSFPCTYFLDVDGDNKKDLVATPNTLSGENNKSVWYYKNTSLTNTVNFQFIKTNLFQDEMIEVGQNSFPVVFDYNADGKKDLLIGTYGYFIKTLANPLSARLTLYENIGTLSQPTYSLISRDYAGLSAYPFLNNVMPSVGDIDNDLDIDICFGTSNGQIHWLENTAGVNNTCNFSVFHSNAFSFTTNSAASAPQLFDLDKDGKLDLLIGTKNGKIAYYRNTSSALNIPTFSLITNFLGSVDVKSNPNIFGIDGFATPFFYNEGSATKLLVGSVNGNIFFYDVPSNNITNFNLIRKDVNFYNEGGQSTLCFEDVNNDNKRDLFIGNASGGLSFFSSKSAFVSFEEFNNKTISDQLFLYPNPSNSDLNIRLNSIEFESANIVITDLLGKELINSQLFSNTQTIPIDKLLKGIYLVKISMVIHHQNFKITKKIIKE